MPRPWTLLRWRQLKKRQWMRRNRGKKNRQRWKDNTERMRLWQQRPQELQRLHSKRLNGWLKRRKKWSKGQQKQPKKLHRRL
ncbi:hypothetical protein BJV78DRAFT_1240264 [Lactifluus subvellereus]|nr:hypothetical protein BJV78DRAFT_1240264 [Lactifluus subvellereus]